MFGQKKTKTKGLNIIIVGCGRAGSTLVEELTGEGHDITVIDTDASKVAEITNMHDIMGIVGNGASFSLQIEAGIKETDLLIAVTDSDELNLLCCTVASRVGDCATIARVRNPEYSLEVDYLRDKLGLAMIINPEFEASREMSKILSLPSALEINSFAHGQASLVKFKIREGTMIDSMTVKALGQKVSDVLICAVERDKQIHIPTGEFVLKAGDIVSIVAPRKAVKPFFKDIGIKTNQVKSAMIVGGGNSGYYLAKQLIHSGISVKLIEADKARCEELSLLLPKAIIINGDGSDEDLLREEGIRDAEAFIPLTGNDEENILLTLFANQVTSDSAKVITKINRITFNDVINRLDLGSVIYPRYLTAEAITAYVRAKSAASRSSKIETLYHLFDHRVEAIEFTVDENSDVTNVPISELELKKDLLISFINRQGKIIIPSGQDTIKLGDAVMIVTTQKGLTDVSDILA